MLRRGLAAAAAVLGLAGLCGGCLAPQHSFTLASLVSSPANGTPRDGDNLIYPERLDRGYTLVLPGIVGRATLDHGIVLGLKLADVPTAIDLHDWTQSWLWPVRNQLLKRPGGEPASACRRLYTAGQARRQKPTA